MVRRTSLIAITVLTAAFVLLVMFAVGPPAADTTTSVALATTEGPDTLADPRPHLAVEPYGSGLAPTPPMGWNGFNHFARNVNDDIVRSMARALVRSGLARAGYRYVNLDGGWDLIPRAPDGQLQPDPRKFPHGIKAVADYVHSRGLKFGIYTSVGLRNCAQTSAGSFGHFDQDAHTFAAWGVDYVKADWCSIPPHIYPGMSREDISMLLAKQFGDALRATGRRIVLDLNDWADQPPSGRNRVFGNMWRTAPDIHDTYSSLLLNFQRNVAYYPAQGPDRWNDPDMLEVGNGGMTATEYRTMFSLWAEMSAPLIAGNDLARMNAETLSILSNAGVIAVDQDPLGAQGYPVMSRNGMWILTKPLATGDRAVVLFNSTNRPEVMAATVTKIGLRGPDNYVVTDLWTGDISVTAAAISATVPAHGVVMLQVTPQA